DRAARGSRGRRNAAAANGRGRYTRAVLDEAPRPLAVDATLRSAAINGLDDDGRPRITRGDLHRKELTGPAGTLILFVVDASGSMAARSRMEAVKGAVLSLLRDARDHRDRVGVIAFRGLSAEVLLPPSGSGELAEQALRSLPTGGRTPLAHALVLTSEVVRTARRSDPDLLVLPVLLTDGKANVGLPGEADAPWEQALDAAARLVGEGVAPLVLDTDAGFVRLGRAGELARALDAACLPLEELTAESVALQVRQHRRAAATAGRRRAR
ncbi:MAG: vWA domain-containing protein, partial [Isosphaeraceae bacterium]